MKEIISRTALFFLGNLILRFLGLILLPVYVRYLSPDEYGIWGLSSSVSLFLNLMMPFGMLMAVGRFSLADGVDSVLFRTIKYLLEFV